MSDVLSIDLSPPVFSSFSHYLVSHYFFPSAAPLTHADIAATFLTPASSSMASDEAKLKSFLLCFESLLSVFLRDSLDSSAVRDALVGQGLTMEQADAFVQMWTKELPRIKSSIVKMSSGAHSLNSFEWRIDSSSTSSDSHALVHINVSKPTSSSHIPALAAERIMPAGAEPAEKLEPACFVSTPSPAPKLLEFQVDRRALAGVLEQIEQIDKVIKQYA